MEPGVGHLEVHLLRCSSEPPAQGRLLNIRAGMLRPALAIHEGLIDDMKIRKTPKLKDEPETQKKGWR